MDEMSVVGMMGYQSYTCFGIVLLLYLDVYLGSDIQQSDSVDVKYKVRKPVNLTCRFQGNDNFTVVWSRKGMLSPLVVGGVLMMDKDRYEIYQDNETSVLSILSADVSDAGKYECSFSVDKIKINSTLFTVTRQGKQFTYIATEKLVVKAGRGDDVHLPCVVQRRHKNKVMWLDPQRRAVTIGTKSLRLRFKISSRQHRRHWTLTIKRVRKSDFGHYTCVVNTDPVISHTIVLRKRVEVWNTTITPSTTVTTPNDPYLIKNITRETTTITISDDFPNVGASHTGILGQDSSRDHLILGISLCGFILSVAFVAGCYLFHRIQKMTRRIVQQEVQLEHSRMRRRDRRLNSETQVYITRQSDYSKQEDRQYFTETNIDDREPPLHQNAKRNNPYCEPWSSNSDIIAAMNAAYNLQDRTTDTKPGDNLCVEIPVRDTRVTCPQVRLRTHMNSRDEGPRVCEEGLNISRGEGEGESGEHEARD